MPRLKRQEIGKAFETEEQQIGQSQPRIQRSTGNAADSLEPSRVEPVDRPVDKEWLEMVAFSRQKITIVVNDSADKNAEDPIACLNNGEPVPVTPRPGWLYRGQEYTIERRFVESLARAKVTTYSQKRETAPDGTPHVINIPHTACRYPFRVIHDPHPRGPDWLRAVLLEPA